MKLFFSPGSCSLASKILLLESGLKFDLEKVDIRAKQYSGGDYRKINPNGSVPVLQLDDGQLLTEGAVILQYIADLSAETVPGLMPKPGTMERYRAQEWLNFIGSEIHKRFSILFGADRMVSEPTGNQQLKDSVKAALASKFDYLAEKLTARKYLMGDAFTAPDAYLYICLRWAPQFGLDLSKWPPLEEFVHTMSARPSVREAVAAEGGKL